MIACLDMYNWPETSDVFAAYWKRVYNQLNQLGVAAPVNLSSEDEDLRKSADDASLLLGQICGITYARNNEERHRFVPLGAFICDDADLTAGTYCSVLISRLDHELDLNNPKTLTVAANEYSSLSGWIVLAQYFSGQSILNPFLDVVISGSHRNSAEMVRQGQADLAALDMISWKMLKRFDPGLGSGLTIVGRTSPRPGLPLVTSTHHDNDLIAALKEALYSAIVEPDIKDMMAGLGIMGLHDNDPDAYLELLKL